MNLEKLKKHPKCYYYTDNGILFYSDCLDILPELEQADLVIADPPYGLKENAYRVASRTKLVATTDYGDFEWDSKPATQEEIKAIISAGKNAIIWGGNYFHVEPSRGWLVWDKMNSGNFADCELAWTNLKTSVRILSFMWNGMLRQGEARGKKRTHPAQKPVELMLWCMSFVPDIQFVIDPYLGSGSTAVGAEILGIKWAGIEISEKYCEIAAKRIELEVKKPKISKLKKETIKLGSFSKKGIGK
jgi:DNA modification methylase